MRQIFLPTHSKKQFYLKNELTRGEIFSGGYVLKEIAQKIFILDKLFIKHSGTLDVIKTTCIQ